MAIELKIPSIGESITEVQIASWRKAKGEWVQRDEALVEIETDKATVELPAPVSGILTQIGKEKGAKATVGETIGYMEEAEKPGSPEVGRRPSAVEESGSQGVEKSKSPEVQESRSREVGDPNSKLPTLNSQLSSGQEEKSLKVQPEVPVAPRESPARIGQGLRPSGEREEEIIPMSPLRRRVAERLVQAQQTAALLTTFNEIDMSAVMALRGSYKEVFQKKYGIKLGFMSFFVKAAIEALKKVPQVNAEIRGTDLVYRNYYDIGVAVGGGKGLVVPVLRSAERMSFAEIELAIDDFARRAAENKITLEELEGGTFTISNGGIYGSLFSTPIVNPPQSGILGMHAIQERPVARQGQVVIRPMMYVALTYDHRLIDGREGVTFLRTIKELVEDLTRILLEI